MAAGNGNAAWLSIQENGLHELQKEAEKRAEAKLQQTNAVDKLQQQQQQQQQQQKLDGTAAPFEPGGKTIAPMELLRKKPAPKFDGFTGLPI